MAKNMKKIAIMAAVALAFGAAGAQAYTSYTQLEIERAVKLNNILWDGTLTNYVFSDGDVKCYGSFAKNGNVATAPAISCIDMSKKK